MKPQPMTRERFISALRDAFEAGKKQGEEFATAYKWGEHPDQTDDEAFSDMFESWESGWSGRYHIRKALMRCKPARPEGDG